MNSHVASSLASTSAHLFNKITGVCFVILGQKCFPVSDSAKKVNVGLQLKHFKQVKQNYNLTLKKLWLISMKLDFPVE